MVRCIAYKVYQDSGLDHEFVQHLEPHMHVNFGIDLHVTKTFCESRSGVCQVLVFAYSLKSTLIESNCFITAQNWVSKECYGVVASYIIISMLFQTRSPSMPICKSFKPIP
jgi:hypothetical protein